MLAPRSAPPDSFVRQELAPSRVEQDKPIALEFAPICIQTLTIAVLVAPNAAQAKPVATAPAKTSNLTMRTAAVVVPHVLRVKRVVRANAKICKPTTNTAVLVQQPVLRVKLVVQVPAKTWPPTKTTVVLVARSVRPVKTVSVACVNPPATPPPTWHSRPRLLPAAEEPPPMVQPKPTTAWEKRLVQAAPTLITGSVQATTTAHRQLGFS